MTSSRDKGNRRERQAVAIYERAGFDVERATAGGFQSPDYFDLFDFMAAKPDAPIHFVQVKSNVAAGIETWAAEAAAFARPGVTVEMVVCHDREGWRLLTPVADGTVTPVDEREQECAMGDGLAKWLDD